MTEYRKEYLRANLGTYLSIVLFLVAILWLRKFIIRRKKKNKLKLTDDDSWEGDSA